MSEIIDILLNNRELLAVLVIFNLLDIISAFPKIWENGFKSSILRQGLVKKCSYYIAVIGCACLDYIIADNGAIVNALTIIFIGNEAFSVLVENLGPYIPLPQSVKEIVIRLKEGKDGGHKE